MKEEQKQKYVDDIVSGSLPDQESFTKEEMNYIAMSILAWCAEQIDHTWLEMKHDDIDNLVANCEYKTPNEAIQDVEQGMEDEMLGLRDFIMDYFSPSL